MVSTVSQTDMIKYSTSGKEKPEEVYRLFLEEYPDFFIKDATYLDCGSGSGAFSLLCATQLKNVRVFSYEGYYDSFMKLVENVKQNSAYNVKADDHHILGENGRSLLSVKDGIVNKLGIGIKTMVETRKIDSLTLPELNMIKVSVPGAAVEVIKGGYKTIANSLPSLIIEVVSQKEENQILDLVLEIGYTVKGRIDYNRLEGISSTFLLLQKE